MAELADAADSKSAEVHPSWGFNSPSRHHPNSLVFKQLRCFALKLFAPLRLRQFFGCAHFCAYRELRRREHAVNRIGLGMHVALCDRY